MPSWSADRNSVEQLAAEFAERLRRGETPSLSEYVRCLRNGTVVILSTIPPRSGLVDRCKLFNDAVRRVASDKQVPLSDYYEAILKRRPDDWDGSAAKFKEVSGDTYDVPTLVSRDGVHPSYPGKYRDYSEESLKHNGYALRTYLTRRAYGEVLQKVLQPKE